MITWHVLIEKKGGARGKTGTNRSDNASSVSSLAGKGKEEDYNDIFLKSYDLLEKKNFPEAKKLYDKGMALKEKKFNEEVSKANKAFAEKNYDEAKVEYLLALSINRESPTVRKKLKETQNKLDYLASTKTEGSTLEKVETRTPDTIVTPAVNSKLKENLAVANENKKANNTVAAKAISDKLTANDKLKEDSEEVNGNDEYDSVVARATELFNKKAYNQALPLYQKAGLLRPGEDLPPKMIRFVKTVISNLPEEQKRDEDLRRKARIIEIKDKGNDAVLNKDWQTARTLYSEMLTLHPVKGDEEFARKKIETIDLALKKIGEQTPVKKEPEVVAAPPKNKREARAQRILAERNAILAAGRAATQKLSEVGTSSEGAGPAKTFSKSSPDFGSSNTASNDVGKISYWTLDEFKTDFRNAENVKWTLYPNFSKAVFIDDEDKVEAFYDFNNTLIGTSRNISSDKLPTTAKRNFLKKYPDLSIKEVIYFEGVQEIAYYISAEDEKEKVTLRMAADNGYKPQSVIELPANLKTEVNIAGKHATDNKSGKIKELMDKAASETNKKNWSAAKELYNQVLSLQPTKDDQEYVKKKVEILDLDIQLSNLEAARAQKSLVEKKTVPVATPNKEPQQNNGQATVSSNGGIAQKEKTRNEVTVVTTPQATPIPYSHEELVARYPSLNFDQAPLGQVYDMSDIKNRSVHYDMSKRVLAEAPQLSLSDSNNNVKLTCQNVVFEGKNAYIKLLIQNKSATADFLTGPMQLAFIKSDGVLQKLNPRFISDFPVVMPQKEYAVVYVADAFIDIDPNDIFYLEMGDRMQKTKLTVIIPKNIYLQQKSL